MPVPHKFLNDGHKIPQLGLGIYKITNDDCIKAVSTALKAGYRHFDTAKFYDNEKELGTALRSSGIVREDVFITTKLWNSDQGYDNTLRAFDESLKRLNLDYIDLYLIHWPMPAKDLFVETWRAFIRLQEEKLVRSIGVSNFRIVDLERLNKDTGVLPAINQVELHPHFQQRALRIFHEKNDILTEAWSPLGRGRLIEEPKLEMIAKAHGKSVVQIILRWHMENGIIAIPKSQSPQRIKENIDIFDFQLTAQDHDILCALDKIDGRTGADPSQI